MTDNKNIHVNYFEVPGEYDGELSEVEELRKRVDWLYKFAEDQQDKVIRLNKEVKELKGSAEKGAQEMTKNKHSFVREKMKKIFDTGKIPNQPTMEMFEALFDSIVFKDEI